MAVSISKNPVKKTPLRSAPGGGGVASLFRGTDKSLWNFWRDGVTSSFLGTFLTCREQCRLHYCEGLQSRSLSLALEFGTCCHWVLEQAYGEVGNNLVPGTEEVQDWLLTYEKKWKAETPKPTPKQLEQQELVYGLAEQVLPTYFWRWIGDFTGKYKYGTGGLATPKEWESLEEVFKVDFTFPDGKTVPIRGRRDGVFLDAKGKLWVFDTKCRSVIVEDDLMETLPLDLQQMLYLSVTEQEFGRMPAGVQMNIIRRPGQRRGTEEKLPEFLERVRKDVSNPKRFDHYFIRQQMSLVKSELEAWRQKQLAPLMQDVRDWWEGKAAHYLNPNNLISKYGRCALFAVLTANDRSGCYKRTKVFAELD